MHASTFVKIVFIILMFFNVFAVQAQTGISEGARLLFSGIKTKLTSKEKNQVYLNTGFVLAADKKQFLFGDDPTAIQFPFTATVLVTDLNKDSTEEICLVFGNTYTSGNIGSNVLLFIKNKQGIYQSNFGFSGSMPLVLTTMSKGFPDLVIGGPGDDLPVWRWDGRQYIFYRKISRSALEKRKPSTIKQISNRYLHAGNQR
ncbi:MAG TPA: hypothetical protein PLC48_00750 [Ferruginibacter sp.]|nr:hypothetical protein [Ferruginibacter sp.]